MILYKNKKRQFILDRIKGKTVSAIFTKGNGQSRPMWGIARDEQRDDKHNIITLFDLRLKSYRRLNLNNPYSIKSGDKVFINHQQ